MLTKESEHRPYAGMGLSDPALNCIKTIRNIENLINIWDLGVVEDLEKELLAIFCT